MIDELTQAVLSDLHRQRPSRLQARSRIFDANYVEVTAWKLTSNRPVLQSPENSEKDLAVSIGSKFRGNGNRSPST
jgi:hypothetical protein